MVLYEVLQAMEIAAMKEGPIPSGTYETELAFITDHKQAAFRIKGGEYNGRLVFGPSWMLRSFEVEVELETLPADSSCNVNSVKGVSPK